MRPAATLDLAAHALRMRPIADRTAAVTAAERARASRGRLRQAGLLHLEHRTHEQRRVETESGGDCGEESDDAEIEPVDGGEPPGDVRGQTRGVGARGSSAPAKTLRDEEKAEAEPEADVDGPDDAEVERTETNDLGVAAEQAQPQAG